MTEERESVTVAFYMYLGKAEYEKKNLKLIQGIHLWHFECT